MMKKITIKFHIVWIIGIAVFLLWSAGTCILAPVEVNEYENRPANLLPELRITSFLDGTFQDGTERALSDQVLLSTEMKRNYNLFRSGIEDRFLQSVLRTKPMRYIHLNDEISVFGGTHLTHNPQDLDVIKAALNARRDNLNACAAAHPELTFYLYFIERERDINLETLEKVGAWEYLRNGLEIPTDQTGAFSMDSFETYSRYYYRTDHHWNCFGSYRGYQEICGLLGIPQEEQIPCGEAVLVQHGFFGSKSAALGADTFTEDFYAFRYPYPYMKITINGESDADYGWQEGFLAGTEMPVKYGLFYGGDCGEVIFDTGRMERDNLLVIGDSFDNAILKLLASHFHITCAVDLRAYEEDAGQPFDLFEYTRDHGIDRVLVVGSMSFYCKPEFELRNGVEG
ncbi:MAG: hypothetical protein IJ206_02645 [Oscillospiraceae bacterium]|nr:hypothetical protein [Oscillospiraceae bacterium]